MLRGHLHSGRWLVLDGLGEERAPVGSLDGAPPVLELRLPPVCCELARCLRLRSLVACEEEAAEPIGLAPIGVVGMRAGGLRFLWL